MPKTSYRTLDSCRPQVQAMLLGHVGAVDLRSNARRGLEELAARSKVYAYEIKGILSGQVTAGTTHLRHRPALLDWRPKPGDWITRPEATEQPIAALANGMADLFGSIGLGQLPGLDAKRLYDVMDAVEFLPFVLLCDGPKQTQKFLLGYFHDGIGELKPVVRKWMAQSYSQ